MEKRTRHMVMTAFFSALVFLGIQSFRIPVPAAFGMPFVHFAHIFVVFAILFLGTRGGMIAGCLGLLLFDVLNGYVHAIPNVFVSVILECLLAGLFFTTWKMHARTDRKHLHKGAVITAVIYAVLNIIIDFVWSAVQLMLIGNTLASALAAEVLSIPATVINSVFTVIGVAVLYLPLAKAFDRILG